MCPRRGLTLVVGGCLLATASTTAAESPRYDRDIRPILSDHCFACHGPDAEGRQAGLRLDIPQPEPPNTASGLAAITPGRPEASELVARILADDPDVVMPPPATNKPLSSAQKRRLADWIAAGAPYERHWAYVPPVRPAVPTVANDRWPRNPIDSFVLARLEQEGLAPAPEADRSTLVRRLALDLTGLPPARGEAEAFLADTTADAYERLVERLLASPHYGERMAVDWLDAARYADTNGYQVDRDREHWLWRDWVIAAFNTNLPFDQFTIEQLAGDLLPEPTREQRIATGFHRNHMLNEEGGIIPEEFLAEYTADRVETTATVWLGQTFNCARCHDHKFDPFTQRDFYALKAFFHGIDEKGIGIYSAHVRVNAPPFLRVATPDQEARLAELEAARAAAAAALDELRTVAAANAAAAAAPDAAVDADAADAIKQAEEQLAAHTKARNEFEASIPTALVMAELPEPRPTHILVRGDYTNPGEAVTADTPAILPAMAADLPKNRLGLARWLVAPDHPLTARVAVNRVWQAFFGTGLVATPEDFGSQGGLPSHPELLDWLAVEFRESGWDMKRLVTLIVTSATYRQQSAVPPGLADRDPTNRLLARGPRFRLQAEFVRDQALAVSGLLVPRLGGPSVKPYHPPGLYEQVVNQRDNPDATYTQDTGPGLHRRSLYTYWKRSVPHPAMLAFDAPFRETCTVKRSQTNTPLQALTLMNDPTFVEAAKFLAARMIREGGDSAADRLTHGVWLVLARPPAPAELELLGRAVERFRTDFAADAAAAKALLEVGEATLAPPSDSGSDPASDTDAAARDLAAYTLVAQMLLCRDEALMKN